MKKLLLALAVILAIVFATILYINFALPNVGPPPDIQVEITQDKVLRGKYLSHHVMLCGECHSKRDFSLFSGPPLPGTEFAGGEVFDHSMGFPGIFVSPNITPAGIGHWTDGELFRLITTGVKPDGNPIFPVMPYHSYGEMDSEDIKAVIAYLRTLEPVETAHPESLADFPFSLIMRTIPKPAALSERPDRLDAVAYGAYIFNAAACGECHTQFEDGKFVGPVGAGGREFEFPDGSVLRSANITPHSSGIAHMSREDFIQRFKAYAAPDHVYHKVNQGEFQTIMPWSQFAGMEVEDLGAIWDYLQSLDPVDNYVQRFSPPQIASQ